MSVSEDGTSSGRMLAARPRKIPREGRPDRYAAEDLQRFLKEDPPEDYLATHMRRPSRKSRSKRVIKTLLRARSPPSILLNHLVHSGNLTHNCVLLRQAVPGQHIQYNRIVRDSSQFDSLETRSTFQVNYDFERHDITENEAPSKRTMFGKKNDRSLVLDPLISSTKTQSRIHPQFKSDKVPMRRLSGLERVPVPDATKHRRRSARRSPFAKQNQGIGPINRGTGLSRIDASDMDMAEQEQFVRRGIGDAPQIQDFALDATIFPASDLINSWGQRHSNKVMGSSNKLATVPALPSSSRGDDTENKGPGRVLPLVNPKKHKYNLSNSNRRTPPHVQPVEMPQRKLASPVKLGRSQQPTNHTNSNVKFKSQSVPLVSNPSNSHRMTLSKLSEKHQTKDDCTRFHETPSTDGSVKTDELNWTRSGTCFSGASESIVSSTEVPLPMDRIRSKSRERSPPSTPAPTSPLPPIPLTALSKQASIGSPMKKIVLSERISTTTAILEANFPPKSPARTSQRVITGLQQRATMQKSTERPYNTKPDPVQSEKQHSSSEVMDDNFPDTSDLTNVSNMKWPQPPSSRPSSEDQQKFNTAETTNRELVADYDPFHHRKERTDSLKRQHMQKALQQSELFRNNHPTSPGPQSPSHSMADPSNIKEHHPPSRELGYSQAMGASDDAEYLSSQRASRPDSYLSIMNARTEADIKPEDKIRVQSHRTISGRTVYRSHSTQMSPEKEAEPVQSQPQLYGAYHATKINDSNEYSDQPRASGSQHRRMSTADTQSIAMDDASLYAGTDDMAESTQYIFDVIDVSMGKIERRLEAMLLGEMDRRFAAINRRLDLLEIAVIGAFEQQAKDSNDEEANE